MESRSYRGKTYDDNFRLEVVSVHEYLVSRYWNFSMYHSFERGQINETSGKFASVWYGVSLLSVYKWKQELLDKSIWTVPHLRKLGEYNIGRGLTK